MDAVEFARLLRHDRYLLKRLSRLVSAGVASLVIFSYR